APPPSLVGAASATGAPPSGSAGAKPPPPPPGAARPMGGPAPSDQATTVLPPTGNGGPPPAARGWRPSPARIALAVAVVAAAALGAWSTWQPERSDSASDHALDLAADGKYVPARAKANSARSYDPLSPKPLLVLAAIDASSGHPLAAQAQLEKAVRKFPADPTVWLRLADFQLNGLGHAGDSLRTVRGVLYLDPNNKAAQTIYFNASNKLHPPPAATPAPATPPAAPTPPPTPSAPPKPPGG
ncbi:MAG: tetratricopeptide repeat protein, partial [Gaiellaceae bacterium]